MKVVEGLFIPICVLFLLHSELPVQAQQPVVGQLLSVRGKVDLAVTGHRGKSIDTFDQVKAGCLLKVHKGSEATLVLYKNGDCLRLAAGCCVQIRDGNAIRVSGPAPRRTQSIGQQVLSRIRGPVLTIGPRAAGIIIRGAARPNHLTPIGAVRTSSITLHWQANNRPDIDDDITQTVEIKDARTQQTVYTSNFDRNTRTCNIASNVLHAGGQYEWTVTLVQPGADVMSPIIPLAVLSTPETDEVSVMEKSVIRNNRSASVMHALLGDLYEHFNLYSEAVAQYETASIAAPGDKGLKKAAQRLRRQLDM